jgi:hypothetical protein
MKYIKYCEKMEFRKKMIGGSKDTIDKLYDIILKKKNHSDELIKKISEINKKINDKNLTEEQKNELISLRNQIDNEKKIISDDYSKTIGKYINDDISPNIEKHINFITDDEDKKKFFFITTYYKEDNLYNIISMEVLKEFLSDSTRNFINSIESKIPQNFLSSIKSDIATLFQKEEEETTKKKEIKESLKQYFLKQNHNDLNKIRITLMNNNKEQEDSSDFLLKILNLLSSVEILDLFHFKIVKNEGKIVSQRLVREPYPILHFKKKFYENLQELIEENKIDDDKREGLTLDIKKEYLNSPQYILIGLSVFEINNTGIPIKKQIKINDFDRNVIINNSEYQIIGMVLHRGKSINSGHYISCIKFNDINVCYDDILSEKLITFENFTSFITSSNFVPYYILLKRIDVPNLDYDCNLHFSWKDNSCYANSALTLLRMISPLYDEIMRKH